MTTQPKHGKIVTLPKVPTILQVAETDRKTRYERKQITIAKYARIRVAEGER